MAYQQHFPYDTPSRQHYDHQITSYAIPSPHSQGQRVSKPSEQRFGYKRGYGYENGAQGTREYGEYNNRVRDYAWADSPKRHDLEQPSSYRSAQGEGQVTYNSRYDGQYGLERANRSNVEIGSQGRGSGRGEGAGPGPATRPVKPQKNEAAVYVQTQPKPRMSVWVPHSVTHPKKESDPDQLADSGATVKQSIIPQPTSPVSTAWDNPFPTFPTGRSKAKATEGRIFSDRSGEMKNPDGAREGGSLEGRHQRKSRPKESPDAAWSQHYLQNVVERGSRDQQYHFAQGKADHPSGGQQGRVESTKTIPRPAQNPVHSLPSRSANDDRFVGQNEVHGRREQVSDQSESIHSGPPLASATAFDTGSQRSMTLPCEFTALRLEPEPYQGYHGSSEWQEPGPTGAYYGPDSHVIIPPWLATSGGKKSSERGFPGMDDGTHSYKASVESVPRPKVSKGRLREYSLGEFFDSYGVPTSEKFDTGSGGSYRWPSLEDEMPNFDLVPMSSTEHSREPTFEHHLRPQWYGSGVVAEHSSTVGGVERDQESYPEEPVSQSILQLDHGGQSQVLPDNSAEFVFELVGDAPAVPPGITSRSDSTDRHLYEHKVNVMSYRQHNDYPVQPYKQSMRPSMEASLAAGAFDDWSQEDWQRHAQDQHVPPLPRQPETPALRAHTRVSVAQPHLLSSSSDQPVPGHPPSSDPDALPEHPTPVRPGLMQGAMGSQIPKPPPVRQYDNSLSPIQQSAHTSRKSPSRASPKKESFAPVTLDELVKLRQVIKANQKDQKTQLVLAQKLVEAASVLADEGGLADSKTTSKNREKYIFDAHKIIKKLVNSGNADAMFYLADCHGRGLLGLESDDKEAFTLYQSAAKAGHAQSAYRVAVCCEMGQEGGGGTRRDPLKAMQWYKRAAMLGDTPAMYKMGMILLKGLLGQSRNSREAIVWLKRAADRADEENPHALHELVGLSVLSSIFRS